LRTLDKRDRPGDAALDEVSIDAQVVHLGVAIDASLLRAEAFALVSLPARRDARVGVDGHGGLTALWKRAGVI
jgi:hypothetical protein